MKTLHYLEGQLFELENIQRQFKSLEIARDIKRVQECIEEVKTLLNK